MPLTGEMVKSWPINNKHSKVENVRPHNIHVKLWDLNTSQGVNLASPFTPLMGGDFVNSKFATYFHHLDRLITVKMLIKPLFNLQSTIIIVCDNYRNHHLWSFWAKRCRIPPSPPSINWLGQTITAVKRNNFCVTCEA